MGAPIQKGIIRLKGGSLGETTFVKSKEGYTAKEKIMVNPYRWKHHARFGRSRENAADFSTASTTAKLIKSAVSNLRKGLKDQAMFLQLKNLVAKIIKLDPVNQRGQLHVQVDKAYLLAGFDMNSYSSLKSMFNTRMSTSANRETGELMINIPSFIPPDRITPPKGATHFQIVSAGAAIDFGKGGGCTQTIFKSEIIQLDDTPTQEMQIVHTIAPNRSLPLFLFLGLKFTQVISGKSFLLANAKMDPLCIVDVFTV